MKEPPLQTCVAMLLLQDDEWSVLGAAGAQGVSCGDLCYLPSSLLAATVSGTLLPVLWGCSQYSWKVSCVMRWARSLSSLHPILMASGISHVSFFLNTIPFS